MNILLKFIDMNKIILLDEVKVNKYVDEKLLRYLLLDYLFRV